MEQIGACCDANKPLDYSFLKYLRKYLSEVFYLNSFI